MDSPVKMSMYSTLIHLNYYYQFVLFFSGFFFFNKPTIIKHHAFFFVVSVINGIYILYIFQSTQSQGQRSRRGFQSVSKPTLH